MDGPPATPRALRSRARAPDIGDLLGLTSGKGTLFPGGGFGGGLPQKVVHQPSIHPLGNS
jgi:hypothetical protein